MPLYKKVNQYYLDRTVILRNLLYWNVTMKWNIQVLKVRWIELDALKIELDEVLVDKRAKYCSKYYQKMCYMSFNTSQMCLTTSTSIISWTSSVCDFPFQHVGVDYAGPLYVRDNYSKSVELYKAYIRVFTCTTTQCTHPELVTSFTTETLILAIKRFISQRGEPYFFISDNFKTFVSVLPSLLLILL